jgi:hypothetical protein
VVATGMLMPGAVSVTSARRVFFLEEGGVWSFDGALRCYDAATQSLHMLVDDLDVRVLYAVACCHAYCHPRRAVSAVAVARYSCRAL